MATFFILWCKMHMKNKILKILLLILIYVAMSVVIYFILKYFGLLNVNNIRNLIQKYGLWSYLIYFIFQISISTFICIIPFEDEILTASAILLFGPLKGFFVASFNMFATSSIQFFIGRKFCKSLVEKIIGEDSIKKYQNYLSIKGEIMLPILYAIPLFPHDSLCILAGLSKMKYWYFAPITLFMRSIEIACICFLGCGLIDFSSLTILDWIIIANLLIIDAYLILKLHKFVDNKLNSRQ